MVVHVLQAGPLQGLKFQGGAHSAVMGTICPNCVHYSCLPQRFGLSSDEESPVETCHEKTIEFVHMKTLFRKVPINTF